MLSALIICLQIEKKDDLQRKTSRDKGPAPPPPIPQAGTSSASEKEKGPAPLPPVPLPTLPTPPSSPITPPSTPPFELKAVNEPQKEASTQQQDEKVIDGNILDAVFKKILSENRPIEEQAEANSPEQSLTSVVVTTSQERNKNTSTIIISDMVDPSNSLATNISQVASVRSLLFIFEWFFLLFTDHCRNYSSACDRG